MSLLTTLLVSDGGTISVGSVASASNFDVSGSELQNISAANLSIGDSSSGDITVGAITAAQSNNTSDTITLDATGNGKTITFNNGDGVFNALSALADKAIAIYSDLTTDTGALSLDADADSASDSDDKISFYGDRSLVAGTDLTLDAGNKIYASANLSLNAKGNVQVNDDLNIVGNLTIDADSDENESGNFILSNGFSIDSEGDLINIQAADVSIEGEINAAEGSVVLSTSSNSNIAVGDISSFANYHLDNNELQQISAQRLQIQGESVFIANAEIFPSTSGKTQIVASGSQNAIQVLEDSSFSGKLELLSNYHVNIGADLSGDGDLLLAANHNNNQIGKLVVGSASSISGNSVEVGAKDIDLYGSIEATQDVSIYASEQSSMHIGERSFSFTLAQRAKYGSGLNAGFKIDSAELSRIDAGRALTLGKDNSLLIMESLQLDSPASLNLQAHPENGHILFIGDSSISQEVFRANAGEDIMVDGNLELAGLARFNSGYFLLQSDRVFEMNVDTGPLYITADTIELKKLIKLNGVDVFYNGNLIIPTEGPTLDPNLQEAVQNSNAIDTVAPSILLGNLSILSNDNFSALGSSSESGIDISHDGPEEIDLGFSDFEGMEITPLGDIEILNDRVDEDQTDFYKEPVLEDSIEMMEAGEGSLEVIRQETISGDKESNEKRLEGESIDTGDTQKGAIDIIEDDSSNESNSSEEDSDEDEEE